MGFDPFGRTEQSRFFSVPTCIDQGAPRLPPFFDEPADRLGLGHQRHVSREWVGGAEHPGIVMIAADDPMIRFFGAANFRNDVVDRLLMPVGQHFQMDLGGPRPQVVGDRQATAPCGRRHRAAERGEQRFGIPVGNRQYRDFQDRPGFAHRETLGLRRRTGARCERITAVQGQILDRAALHAVARTETASRINVAGPVPVIAGIRINQTADGAVFVRELRFESAPSAAVADDDDAAFDAQIAPFEFLVVVGHSLIDVDQFGGDIAVCAVHIVGRQLVPGFLRDPIRGHRRLTQLGRKMRGRHQFHDFLSRSRIQHGEFLDGGIPPPFAKFLQ